MELTIGRLARLTGVPASALRYYERAGLMPRPARQSGQRRYAANAPGRVRMIQLARDAGFSIKETRLFLSGFSETVSPAARWRALAERKLAELEAQQARIASMQALLRSGFHCRCLRIEDCERALLQHLSRQSG
ncbi:MAG: MerR family transcriptional regulator [Gammaproteobacteria bacterium]|nr:MerR family transcriptional regulator [Gammaproteobacteria bacterium]